MRKEHAMIDWTNFMIANGSVLDLNSVPHIELMEVLIILSLTPHIKVTTNHRIPY